MNLIVTTGAEPAVVARPGHYDLEKTAGGPTRQVWREPVHPKPAGPPSVILVVPGKEPAYLTSAEARTAAAHLVDAADKLDTMFPAG